MLPEESNPQNENIGRDFILGCIANILFYFLLRLWASGKFGQVPLLVLSVGPILPVLSPIVFLSLRRRQMALGALAVGAASFAVSIIFNF